MSQYSKQLRIKHNNYYYSCKMYTTAAEAGAYNVPFLVDGTQCYLATFPIGDRRGTLARVKFPNGTERTIGTDRQPDYSGYITFGEGTHTYTVPIGVTRIKVTSVGGGGGGCTITDDEYDGIGARSEITNEFNWLREPFQYHPEGIFAGNGGDTYIDNGAVMARGGVGGFFRRGAQRGSNTWFIDYNGSSAGGYPNGRNGRVKGSIGSGTEDSGFYAKGWGLQNYMVDGDYGRGGRFFATGNYDPWFTGWYGSGGGGGWNQAIIDVTPGQVLTLHVGGGGASRLCDCWGTHYDYKHDNRKDAWPGTGGFIILEHGGNIT